MLESDFQAHVTNAEHLRKDELIHTQVLAQSLFEEAAAAWLESRKPYIGPRTYKDYQQYLGTLSKFFGELKLTEIFADHIRAYQRMRLTRACASRVNQELSVVPQMLKRIGRWDEIDYQPLPAHRASPGRALTDQEYDRLFRRREFQRPLGDGIPLRRDLCEHHSGPAGDLVPQAERC